MRTFSLRPAVLQRGAVVCTLPTNGSPEGAGRGQVAVTGLGSDSISDALTIKITSEVGLADILPGTPAGVSISDLSLSNPNLSPFARALDADSVSGFVMTLNRTGNSQRSMIIIGGGVKDAAGRGKRLLNGSRTTHR